jgi:hypothetical protein
MRAAPLAAAIMLAGVAACQAPGATGGAGAAGKTAAVPVAGPSVGVANLTADWVFGDRNEPGPGAVATCAPAQRLTIVQDGQALSASVTRCAGGCKQIELLEGENVAGKVTLAGSFQGNLQENAEGVSYALTFDPASKHLRGTRDGSSFWAAPWVDPGPGVCPAVPSPRASVVGVVVR